MAHYLVRSLSDRQTLETKEYFADSPEETFRLAHQDGLRIVQIVPKHSLLDGFLGGIRKRRSRRFDLVLFGHELLALLQAGLSLIEALEALVERERDQGDHALLQEIVQSLYEGLPLSKALERMPQVFPELFVATISASEHTGDLVEALERYLRYQEQISLVRNKLVSAAIYPAMLLIVGTAVGMFLLIYLVPRFSRVYESVNAELPLASRLLLQWGVFVAQHSLLVTLGLAALLLTIVYVVTNKTWQQRIVSVLARNRVFGPQLQLMQLSRFYRSLGLLVRGGIPVVKGVRMTAALLPAHQQSRVLQAIKAVSEGQPLSDSLQQAGLTTVVALHLLRAGEHHGQLAEVMERIALFHDKEVSRWIDGFLRLFEPLLILMVGGIIGGIVILLYLPIFELAGSL